MKSSMNNEENKLSIEEMRAVVEMLGRDEEYISRFLRPPSREVIVVCAVAESAREIRDFSHGPQPLPRGSLSESWLNKKWDKLSIIEIRKVKSLVECPDAYLHAREGSNAQDLAKEVWARLVRKNLREIKQTTEILSSERFEKLGRLYKMAREGGFNQSLICREWIETSRESEQLFTIHKEIGKSHPRSGDLAIMMLSFVRDGSSFARVHRLFYDVPDLTSVFVKKATQIACNIT